jgi:hypothetical protein
MPTVISPPFRVLVKSLGGIALTNNFGILRGEVLQPTQYATFSDVHAAAQNGDTILVRPGTYTQGHLDKWLIYKSVNIWANGGPVVLKKSITLPLQGAVEPCIDFQADWHGSNTPNSRFVVSLKGIEIWWDSGADHTWYGGAGLMALIQIFHSNTPGAGFRSDVTLENCYLHDCGMGIRWSGPEVPSIRVPNGSTLTVKGCIFRWLGNAVAPTNHHIYGGSYYGLFEGNLFESIAYPEAAVPPSGTNGTPEFTGDYQTNSYPVGHILKWQGDTLVVRGNAFVYDTYGTNSPAIEMSFGGELICEDNWFETRTFADSQDSMIRYARFYSQVNPQTGNPYCSEWAHGNIIRVKRNSFVNRSTNFFRDSNRMIEVSYGNRLQPKVPNPPGIDVLYPITTEISDNVFAGPGRHPTVDEILGSPYPNNASKTLADLADPATRFSGWELRSYAGQTMANTARKRYVQGTSIANPPNAIDVTSNKRGATFT